MLFSKKEKRKRLPDLPARGSRASFDAPFPEDEPEHPLPAFPDSPSHNEFSQAAIKDAIGAHEDEDYHEGEDGEFHPSHPPRGSGGEEKVGGEDKENIKIVEMEEWHPSVHHEEDHGIPPPLSVHRNLPSPRSISPPAVMSHAPLVAARKPEKKASDVFVKIDKYNSARRAMGDVKMKLVEIDELIKRIRETKIREEQEIVAWEKDMENIKARMKDITENIFEKID